MIAELLTTVAVILSIAACLAEQTEVFFPRLLCSLLFN